MQRRFRLLAIRVGVYAVVILILSAFVHSKLRVLMLSVSGALLVGCLVLWLTSRRVD
ncbi:MAG: hypothetical protein WCB04_07195 [Mycobacteriales bacterium]